MSTATSDSIGVQPVVGPEWVAARLGDSSVRIVEVDVSPSAFEAGHIPGAAFWNAYGDLRGVDYRPVPTSQFAGLLARSGIEPDTTVVFYGYAAYLGYWLMRSYGHSRVFLMDGPRDRWVESGYDWSGDLPASASAPYPVGSARNPTSSGRYPIASARYPIASGRYPVAAARYPIASGRYPVVAGRSDLATRADVLELIGDPDVVTVDVRSREEFTGERFWPSGGMQEGGRAGHIPGAVWLPVDIDGQSPEEIRDVCEAAGVGPNRHVVVYCTIGNRASQVWYVLTHLLGYPRVSVYYGSWAEWGMATETPVES